MVGVSHFAFVNPGGPLVPDIDKVRHYAITRLYWQANDVQISAGLFQGLRDNPKWHGVELGIMRDPIWGTLTNVEYDKMRLDGKLPPPLGAVDLARTLDGDLLRLGSSNSQCAVLADIEYHDPAYVQAFLREWRDLRPSRVTGWTMEPLQGGWMDTAFVHEVTDRFCYVYPQTYYGNMSPVDPDLVRADLVERGFPRNSVAPFYNAAHIPTHWDGIAFRFDQLP
jgi:hypothetical protein